MTNGARGSLQTSRAVVNRFRSEAKSLQAAGAEDGGKLGHGAGARRLLHRGGQERAAAVCGDAVAVLYEADHAVEVYVAARKH